MTSRGIIAPYLGETLFSISVNNSYIELLGSNLVSLGKSRDSYNSSEHTKAGKNEHVTQCAASTDLTKFEGKPKENNVTVSNRTTCKILLVFCFIIAL